MLPIITKSHENRDVHAPTEALLHPLLIHSVISRKTVICSTNNELSSLRFSIPVSYRGLVEILSEDGEAAQPFTQISQLADHATEKFLVRSKIVAHSQIKCLEQQVEVNKGEVLTVSGAVTMNDVSAKRRFLHCKTQKGVNLYLNYDTTGHFSPVAGATNISGAHTIETLLKRFKLPLNVRILSGKIPQQAYNSKSPGVLRLIETRKDKVALMLPLRSQLKLLSLPVKTSLQLIMPANMSELRGEHLYRQLLDSASNKANAYMHAIQVLISKTDETQTSHHTLYDDVDEIYPFIRKGGCHPRHRQPYVRSISEPTHPSILTETVNTRVEQTLHHATPPFVTSRLVRQHVVSAPVTQQRFEFCSNDSLTLGKRGILKEFIEKYTASLNRSSDSGSDSNADHDQYFTLEDSTRPSSIREIVDDCMVQPR